MATTETKEQILKRYREGVTWMLKNDDKPQLEETWLKGLKKIEELEDEARAIGVTNDELGKIIEEVRVELGRYEGINYSALKHSTKET